jgi:perosamine synthetase
MSHNRRILQFQPWFGEEEERALVDVIRTGWVGEHSRTREFEKVFSNYVGSKFAVATTSGGIALFLALKSLGIGIGDEVIVPDYTMIATAHAVKLAGAAPVFVDVLQESGNMDIADVEKKITSRTKAMMPTHINGRACDLVALRDLAKERSVLMVEDACQALGSRLDGKHLGTFSDVGCFSLHPSKHVTTGQGGMIVTDSEETYEKLCRLKDYGRFERAKLVELPDHYESFGFNFRFTDLQAALGLAQFAKLDSRLQRIREMYRMYRERVNSKALLKLDDHPEFTPWYADILLQKPKINMKLKAALASQFGIETRVAYKPLHRQPVYMSEHEFPKADFFSARGLWLPSSTFLKNEDIDYVIDALNQVLATVAP